MEFSEKTKSKVNPFFLTLNNLQISNSEGALDRVEEAWDKINESGRMWRFDYLAYRFICDQYDESHLRSDVKDFVFSGGVYTQSPEIMDSLLSDFMNVRSEFVDSLDESNFFSAETMESLIRFYPIISNHFHMFMNFKVNRWDINFSLKPLESFWNRVRHFINVGNCLEDFNSGKNRDQEFQFNEVSEAGWKLLSIGLGEEAAYVWSNLKKFIHLHTDKTTLEKPAINCIRKLGHSPDIARYALSSCVGLGRAYNLIGRDDLAIENYKEAANYWIERDLVDQSIKNPTDSVVHYWSGAQRVLECLIEGYLISGGEVRDSFRNTIKNIFCHSMRYLRAPENDTDALKETLLIIYFMVEQVFPKELKQ